MEYFTPPYSLRLQRQQNLGVEAARNQGTRLSSGELPGVTVTGFMEDMRPYFWNVAICVVPLRSGGGTRVKILESMAARLLVVSTTTGAEGMEVIHGTHIILSDNPESFSQVVVQLLNDRVLGKTISTNGCKLVEQVYDWAAIAPHLESAYAGVFDRNQ